MHQRGGYIEIKEQQEIARLPTDYRAMFYKTFFGHTYDSYRVTMDTSVL